MIEVGMDQHKHFSLACSLDPATGESSSTRLEHSDPERIRQYLRSLAPEVRVSLESTGNWYWLCELLEEEGAQVQLANTVDTRRLLKTRAKTDRLDALALASLSAQGILPQVWLPPQAVRDGRERHRYRLRLVRMQARLKNTVHALLGKLNIEAPFADLFGKLGRAFLEGLALREPYQTELRSALRLLDAVQAEVRFIHQEIHSTLAEDPRATRLQTIPGIGELTAYLLFYEIGPVERFPSDKHLSSYACLCSGNWESAEQRRTLPVGRRGNLYLKAALVEAAHTAVRTDPTLGTFYRKLKSRKGTGKAMVAVARKLAVAVYHVLRDNTVYRPAPVINRRAGKPVLRLGQT